MEGGIMERLCESCEMANDIGGESWDIHICVNECGCSEH